jgi:hypothetical protein
MLPYDSLGFDLSELEALFVVALGVVGYELDEERNLVGFALGTNPFDEGVVYCGIIEGDVVDQNLDCNSAEIDDALD